MGGTIMATVQTPVVSTPSRGATALAVMRSGTLATAAAGGRRARTQIREFGTGIWEAITTSRPGTPPISRTALVFVA